MVAPDLPFPRKRKLGKGSEMTESRGQGMDLRKDSELGCKLFVGGKGVGW